MKSTTSYVPITWKKYPFLGEASPYILFKGIPAPFSLPLRAQKHLNVFFYIYMDRSVLLKNTPRVKFIRNYIRDPSGEFSISSLMGILMTSFPALSQPFANSRWKMASDRFVNIIKRKLHGGLKIWILFSRVKNNIILFWPLENKIHIFAPPCNILYIFFIIYLNNTNSTD